MVELRKARATDTPVCESSYCCVGVSEWPPRPVSEQGPTRIKADPHASELTRTPLYLYSLISLISIGEGFLQRGEVTQIQTNMNMVTVTNFVTRT